ncbi:hypothetical protein H6503_07010 [Candidatus Woesearchaeota archaeon]|nr:hypothetical protein [Candidatus Woesearchaeota archaeon]
MSNVFERSWEITKLTFGVIKEDKEMILYPILSTFFSLLFIVAMVLPSIGFQAFAEMTKGIADPIVYSVTFLIYLGLAFIATFFNVCVVYTAKERFKGNNATLASSFKFAVSKAHLILAWSMLSATIGVIFRAIERASQRLGAAGQITVAIANSILGMIWSIVTLFVVPAMVYNDLGPIAAIKKSVSALKKTWGESLVRYYGLGMIQFALLMVGILVGIGAIIITASIPLLLLTSVIILVLYIVVLVLVFSIANTVFNTALYEFAETGKIPKGYNKEVMQNSFHAKNRPGWI